MANSREPWQFRDEPEPTGAFIVVFQDRSHADIAARHIEDVIGRPPSRSGRYRGRMHELPQELDRRGATLFDDFSMAVLDPALCNVTADAIRGLGRLPEVVTVRPEYRMHAIGWLDWLFCRSRPVVTPPPTGAGTPAGDARSYPAAAAEVTWGLRALRVPDCPFSGKGIKLAVLDTGLDLGHPDFAGRPIVGRSFVAGVSSAQDGLGHGTHVAGTAAGPRAPAGVPRYGVAPDAELHIGKVLGDDGSGREGDILAGILWAIESGCQIISMSLGRRALPGDRTGDYDRVGRIALERGALIVAAAGNESTRRLGVVAPVGAPANARSVLSVGAVDEALAVADFSNGGLDPDGGAIDLSGPGVDVLSAVPGAGRHDSFAGTSMATPHVAGIAALWAESDPALRGQALWDALTRSARELGVPARDGGAGLVQAPLGRQPSPGVA